MARLVAIGDSLTQGFQNGSISKTAWSYPAMIARSLGLSVPTNFRVPSFPGSGLPLNIEELLHYMSRRLGDDISLGEWIFRFPGLFSKFIDEIEELYERGRGRIDHPSAFRGQFHNLSVWGFRVVDSFMVNSEYCDRIIREGEGYIEDDFLGLPSAPMYRTAHKILNPGNQESNRTWTQIDNLRAIAQAEGVENLILWLGANDCLGTVISLTLKEMPADFSSNDPEQRRKYNLTHPDVFRRDYGILVNKVKEVIDSTTQVFVGNIPYVTIPPITRGIGVLAGDETYFDYYGRFFADEARFNPILNSKLTAEDVRAIDQRIDVFNAIINQHVNDAGPNWHLVDLADLLNRLAVKRNHLTGSPEEPLKAYYHSLNSDNHPLLQLNPVPSILLLETQNRIRKQGGLFSLDCIHPSTIGYGIIAELFLRRMQDQDVPDAAPGRLDWKQIIMQDALLQFPPLLWDDIIDGAESNAFFWDVVFRVFDR